MKRKNLALLLAVAMTVTSVDGTALMVSGADFSSEETVQEETESPETDAEVSAETGDPEEVSVEDTDEFADEDQTAVTEEDDESAVEVTQEEDGQEAEIQAEEDFSSDAVGISDDATEIESIDTTLYNPEGVAGFPYYVKASLTFNYENGNSATNEWNLGTTGFSDPDITNGQDVTATLTDIKDSSKVYGIGSQLPAGEYYLQFSCGSAKSEQMPVTVKDIKESPLYKGELSVDKTVKAESPMDGNYAYYSFTAPEKNTYYISECDSNKQCFVKSGDSYTWASESGIALEKGETAYFRFYGGAYDEFDEEQKINFDFLLKTRKDVTNIELPGAPYKFIKGLDYFSNGDWLPGGITVSTSDGAKEVTSLYLASNVMFQGNMISTTVLNADRTEFNWADNGYSLPVGNYTLRVKAGNFTKTVPLTVSDLNYNSFPALKMGPQDFSVDIKNACYKFIPEKSGRYTFDFGDIDAYSFQWYVMNGDVPERFDSVEFEVGAHYILEISADEAQSGKLTVSRTPAISSVQVNDYAPQKFIQSLQTVSLDTITLTITYDDGTKVKYDWDDFDEWHDKYGREMGISLCQKDGDSWVNVGDIKKIQPGTYYYRVYYSEETEDGYYGPRKYVDGSEFPVTVISPDEVEGRTDLSQTETKTVTNDGTKKMFSFKPQADGRYKISFNASANGGRITDNEGNVVCEYVRNNGHDFYGDMKAGRTYYLYTSVDEECAEAQVTVTKAPEAKALETKLQKPEQKYTSYVDKFKDVQLETVLTYTDENGQEKTKTIKDGEQFAGYELGYNTYKTDDPDGETSIGDYTALEAGTWKIVPFLDTTTESEETDIKVTSAEITVAPLDLSNGKVLTENQWETVEQTKGSVYKFTASKEGTYTLQDEGNTDYRIFTWDNTDQTWVDRNESEEIELNAGEICAALVTTYGKTRIRMVNDQNQDSDTGRTLTYTVQDGFNQDIPVAGVSTVEFNFTPNADAYYMLEGVFQEDENNADGYRHESLWEDGKFKEYYSLGTANKLLKNHKYTYKLKFAGMLGLNVSFQQVQQKNIQKIEPVVKSGTELNIFNWPASACNTKVTYADNSSKVYEDTDFTDDYGNYISLVDERTVSGSGAVSYKVYYDYNIMGSDKDLKSTPVTLNAASISSHPEIKVGDTKYPRKDSKDKKTGIYRFTISQDGWYMFNTTPDQKGNALQASFYKKDSMEIVTGLNKQRTSARVKLEKGEYLIDIWNIDRLTDDTASVSIRNAKLLKSVQVKTKPTVTTVLRGFEKNVSFDGMKVTATYADGSTEEVAYGKTDSMGNELHSEGGSWIDSDTYRAYVNLGSYQVSVDFEEATAEPDKIPEIPVNTKNVKPAVTKNAWNLLKFTPDKSGYYGIHVKNAEWNGDIVRASDQKELYLDSSYLESGVTYYISVKAGEAAPEVSVMSGNCKYADRVTAQPTCTKNGAGETYCTEHDVVTGTYVLSATGHQFGAWKVTKKASCVNGTEQRTCLKCKTVETKTIPANSQHKYGSWKTTKEATVLTAGQQERSCSVCGKKETSATAKLKATISLNVPSSVPLKTKQTFQVKATTGKGDKVVSWTSSNKKFVSVSANGKIKGVKAGKSATITVKLQSGLSASFKVKVQKAAVATKSIKVTNASTGKNAGKSMALKRKQTVKLAATVAPVTSKQKVTYASSNKKVVTVTSKGVIKAKTKGKATITVKSGKKTYKIKITVK